MNRPYAALDAYGIVPGSFRNEHTVNWELSIPYVSPSETIAARYGTYALHRVLILDALDLP